MSSVFRAGSQLSSGSVSFVTRRTALTIAVATACGAAALALAAGIAIGMHWPAHGSGDQTANRVEHDYAIDQLGKLNASVAQIEPRIARLTAQVGALRDFEARLNTPRPAPRAPVAPATSGSASEPDTSATDSEGEGGPSLPPRRCTDVMPQPAGHADATRTRQQLDCIAATLSALEQQTADHAIAYAAFPGRMPADSARFGSPFGNRTDPFTQRLSFHPGLDLVAKTGTPILAAAGGRVIFAGEKSGYGNAVEIDHGNGLVTRYGHASRIVVHVGDLVLPRQYVADVGSTGRSTGPHLHFEVLVNGAPVDPAAYLALFAPTPHG
ncbi:peptidoglycan DD-metalloendopeptidase family protein [Paraburkholderia madseniana]|uniref:Peptidoglycan DD-metalloendopeptidase family protein n=1 Tax=Paraburkholderia madseniana TaxID=2599607 RepID=A0A6N6WGE6_9BURK|nr:M23 family metallopeptidase [Paraburkholderia madseniana]KAE8759603.1 peptidoglycan DD-metalloendopeptidase family protein [Paraburkholderia madseniana]NPT67595.1 peptidoglycan DD-metalloendopeptidase family protein [Paraburkholderia madseniana]